jgi:hypothetical protein
MDEQGPLGVEIGDFVVRDSYGLERIDDNQVAFLEYEFGPNPKQDHQNAYGKTKHQIEPKVGSGLRVQDRLSQVKSIENQCGASPKPVGSRSVSRITRHQPILTATASNRKKIR